MNSTISKLVSRIFHRNQEFWNDTLQDVGIAFSEISFLQVLHNNGKMTQEELAERIQIHKSAVTKTVRMMLEKGLIERTKDEKDKRCNYISLTPFGEQRWKVMEERRPLWNDKMLRGISQEDIETTERVLDQILTNYMAYKNSKEENHE